MANGTTELSRFNINASVIDAWKNEATGKHYVKAIATDTEKDYHDERMSENCLNGLANCINTQSPHTVGLLPNHWDAFEIGIVTSGKVIDSPDVLGAKALETEIELNFEYPEARALYNDVKDKKCMKQLSIGGYPNPENESPYYWEPRVYLDSDGGVVQDWTLVLDDVILEHIAVTRPNKAANNRTGFVGTIAKSLGLSKPEKFNMKGGEEMAKNNSGKPEKFWDFKMSAKDPAKGELLVYGDIVNYRWYEEDVSADSFIKDFKSLGDIKVLDIRINSGGGSVFAAAAILSYMKSQKNIQKNVFVDGLAASAASVIAMCGDKIYTPAHAMIMIHNPSTIAWGDSVEMRKVANVLDKIRDSIANAYVEKTGKPINEIIEMMNAETWMTGAEAVELGFADAILDSTEITAYYKNDILNVNGLNFETAKFKNKPRMQEVVKSIEKGGSTKMAKNNKRTEGLVGAITKAVNSFLGNEDEQKPENAKVLNARKTLQDAKDVLKSLEDSDLPDDLKSILKSLENPTATTETPAPPANEAGEEGNETPAEGAENGEGSEGTDGNNGEAEGNGEGTEGAEGTEGEGSEGTEGEGSEGEGGEEGTEGEGTEGTENTFDQKAFKDSIMKEVSSLVTNGSQKMVKDLAASLGKVIGEVVKDQVSPLQDKLNKLENAAGKSKSLEGQENSIATKKTKTAAAEDSEDNDMWKGFITDALPADFKNRKYNETEDENNG